MYPTDNLAFLRSVVSTLACVRLEHPLTLSALTYCTLLNKIHRQPYTELGCRTEGDYHLDSTITTCQFCCISLWISMCCCLSLPGPWERKMWGKGEARDRPKPHGLASPDRTDHMPCAAFQGNQWAGLFDNPAFV